MAARDPEARSRSASIAANASWARTQNWTERTAAAHAASPTSYAYWLNQVTEDGVREQDRAKAATKAHKDYMRQLSAKAAKARRRRRQSDTAA